jgi:predicted transposase/invertase (TIGR01784 family)
VYNGSDGSAPDGTSTDMHFLNPKTDFAFKKIFGSETSRDILISFLNAILELTGEDVIADVTIIDPYLAPKIEGMKDTYLDVRVRDQRGRSYIVEMQVLNVEGFEKRVLYNACKAYVNQLGKGDPYHILTEVVAVTITDFEMFPELGRVVSRFRLRADENPLICHRDLELVFAELPKFTKDENGLETTLDRWLYFLKTARDLTAIPKSLAVEPAIVKALELANRAAWTEEELDDLENREMWIAEQRYILHKARDAEQKARDAEQKGRAKGKAEMLLRQLRRRFTLTPEIEARVLGADSALLDDWMDRFIEAKVLTDVFTDLAH